MSALEKDAWRITFSRGEGRGRGHHRGSPQGPDVHPGRRRGPRERGRPRDPGPMGDARGHQLHGQARARPDLPGADPRAGRAARPAADGAEQRHPPPDRLHRLDRGARGRDHRHLGRRPRAHRRGRDRPVVRAAGHRHARPRLPAGGARRRHAGAHRPHRGRGRPGAARRPDAGRRDLRDHERRRHDGPSQRPHHLRPAPRPQDRHHLRPDRLSPALRFDRQAAERDHASPASTAATSAASSTSTR